MNFKKENWLKPVADQRGFTLTEILVVITIIAILGAIAVTQIMGQFNSARVKTTKIQMRNLGTVLDQYVLDCGSYPSQEQGLEALIANPGDGCPNYNPEGYLKGGKLPKDSFGKEYLYSFEAGKYKIISLGADGAPGGEGFNADLSSDQLD